MKGAEFLRKLQRRGRRNGVPVRTDYRVGKSSHIAVHYGERFTILKDRKKELGPGLYRKMLRAFEKYYETSALMTWRNKPCLSG